MAGLVNSELICVLSDTTEAFHCPGRDRLDRHGQHQGLRPEDLYEGEFLARRGAGLGQRNYSVNGPTCADDDGRQAAGDERAHRYLGG